MENLSSRLQPSSPQLSGLLFRMGQCWRNDVEVEALLTAAVTEICTLLKSECVQICQLQPETQTPILADFRREKLQASSFGVPELGSEVPVAFHELLHSIGTAAIVDVTTQRIRQRNAVPAQAHDPIEPMQTLALRLPQVEALSEMGVRSLLLVPLQNQEHRWGMIAVYYSFPRTFLEADLETVQVVAEYLSIALAQDPQAAAQLQLGSILNSITRQLHLPHELDLQAALESTVAVFEGIGGRLYLSQASKPQVYRAGIQPATSAFTKYADLEQYQVWQHHFETHDDTLWAISDVSQEPELQSLQSVFQPTAIAGVLMIPLWYQQQPLGYLSLFRGGDSSRRSQKARSWSQTDLEMARDLGIHFAAAVQRSREHSQVNHLTATLEQQVQQRTESLQKLSDRQQILLRVITKIRQSLDIDTIFRTTSRELCQAVKAERVAVYQFDENWGGAFVNDFEFATGEWNGLGELGVDLVWNDTYLQETQGGRYRFKETFVVEDIYEANLAPCHIECLEQFQIRALVIAPIFRGKKLWGLLAMYQHSSPRQWEKDDVQFLNHVAEQLGVALQQANLLDQTREQTQHLQQLARRQEALLQVTVKMRQSLEIETIFRTTSQSLCELVNADRVAVYRFNENWGGEFVNDFEFATGEWNSLNQLGVNLVWNDTYLQETQGGRYRHKETFVVDDIHVAQLSPCHVEILEQFQVRALAIAPIFRGQQLWGLLAMYQHSSPRHWEAEDVEFLNHIAEQLGVALQQANLAQPDSTKILTAAINALNHSES